MKKWIVLFLASAVISFAQDAYAPAPTEETQYEDMSQYTSGAPAPETPVVNINEVKSNENRFAISIHPISLFIFSLIDIPMVYLTFEAGITENFSFILRPYILDAEFTDDDDDENLELYMFGIMGGVRYYLNGGHKGVYVEPEFEYMHLGLDYEYEHDHSDDESGSVDGFGFYVVVGYKFLDGHFTLASDVGYGYSSYTAKGENKDDVEEVSAIGFGYTINFMMGFAF